MLTWALRHPPGGCELVGPLRGWNLRYTNLHRWLLLKSLHRLKTAHTWSEMLIKMSTRSEPNFSLFQHSKRIYAAMEERARGAAAGPLRTGPQGAVREQAGGTAVLWGQPCPANVTAACGQGPALKGRPWDSQPGQEPALTGRWCTAAPHSSWTLPGCDAHVGNEWVHPACARPRWIATGIPCMLLLLIEHAANPRKGTEAPDIFIPIFLFFFFQSLTGLLSSNGKYPQVHSNSQHIHDQIIFIVTKTVNV